MQSSQFHNIPIIAHSHLRWDWVWQRPQQFLSRLASRHPVLFVEGPQLTDDLVPYARLMQAHGVPGVTVMQTFLPARRFNDGAWVDAERRRLLDTFLAGPLKGKFERPVQWFYDPMAFEAHAGHHGEALAVYDCMDELSQFACAPGELVKRERRLLEHAAVVFTGGHKMWESKSRFNANVHFYGCGVDTVHFGKARLSGTPLPDDVAQLSGPQLGYMGVVDERLDYGLIADLADANTDWHIVMVGPSCKVDPALFPRRKNIHWLGGNYSELPGYCQAFDVCLMPFALNEATEYINPTKALEYMATGTPVVSTPVSDVVRNFGSVVHIGRGEDFIAHCLREVKRPDTGRIQLGLQLAARNTWDEIVAKLERHVEEALLARSEAHISAKAHADFALGIS